MWLPTNKCADVDFPYERFNAAAYAAAGHTRIIIKATEGNEWVNPELKEWVTAAHDQGMSVGFYHFARLYVPVALTEVNHFLRFAHPLSAQGDLFHLDLEVGLEHNSPSYVGKWATEFIGRTNAATDRHSVPYMDEDYYDRLAGHISNPGGYYWLAAYGPRAPKVRRGDRLWGWQFTDGVEGPFPHSCSGIGKCDISALNAAQVRQDYLRMLRRRRSLKRPTS